MTAKTERAKAPPPDRSAIRAKSKRQNSSNSGFIDDRPSMAEPALSDLLRDPILQHLMRSDGVEPQQLQVLLNDARTRLFS